MVRRIINQADAHCVLGRKVNKPFHKLAPVTVIFRAIVGVDGNGMRIEPSFDPRPKIFKTINHEISSDMATGKIHIAFTMRRQENTERFLISCPAKNHDHPLCLLGGCICLGKKSQPLRLPWYQWRYESPFQSHPQVGLLYRHMNKLHLFQLPFLGLHLETIFRL